MTDFSRGIALFERLFGPALGAEMVRSAMAGPETFKEVVWSKIGPDVWEREILDMRSKLISMLAMFAVLGREVQMKYFVRASLIHGITRAEIEEILLLAGLEAGMPRAADAFGWVAAAIADHDAFLTTKAAA